MWLRGAPRLASAPSLTRRDAYSSVTFSGGADIVVRQFRYNEDNLGYVIHGDREALVVDGGAPGPILDYLAGNGLTLAIIANTHSHGDHTCGDEALRRAAPGAKHLSSLQAAREGELHIEDRTVTVIPTPGHTLDGVSYCFPGCLLSGDTLFTGKVGRCFSGRPDLLRKSIETLMGLPGDTVLYPGHDYVMEYIQWCRTIEPGNPALDRARELYDPRHVRSTLDFEKRVNPFLHTEEPSVAEALRARGIRHGTSRERWEGLLGLM